MGTTPSPPKSFLTNGWLSARVPCLQSTIWTKLQGANLELALRMYPDPEKEDKLIARLTLNFQRHGEIREREDYLAAVRWKSPRVAGARAPKRTWTG